MKIVKLWGVNNYGYPEDQPKELIENHPNLEPIPVGFFPTTDQEIETAIAKNSLAVSQILPYKQPLFVLSQSTSSEGLERINFKDTNFYETKKFPTIKGELREIEYYLDSELQLDGSILYKNLAVKETNAWQYTIDNSTTPAKKFPQKRITRIDYFLDDGTIGKTIETYKHYNPACFADILAAVHTRHSNIIAELGSYLYSILPFSTVDELNQEFNTQMASYISGSGMPLVNAVNSSTHPALTTTIKTAIIDVLTY